jgi:hypothetical protein
MQERERYYTFRLFRIPHFYHILMELMQADLRGRKMTTMKRPGAMVSSAAPMSASSVTLRSNTFQPLSRYAVSPAAIMRTPASNRNTVNTDKKHYYYGFT